MVAAFAMTGPLVFEFDYATSRLRAVDAQRMLVSHKRKAQLLIQLKSSLTQKVLAPLPPHFAMGTEEIEPEQWLYDRLGEGQVLLLLDERQETLYGLVFLFSAAMESGGIVVQIGYLIGEDFWGQGLATEMLAGLVRRCAELKEIRQLAGGVEVGNVASARVLIKSGFSLDRSQTTLDTAYYTLRI